MRDGLIPGSSYKHSRRRSSPWELTSLTLKSLGLISKTIKYNQLRYEGKIAITHNILY